MPSANEEFFPSSYRMKMNEYLLEKHVQIEQMRYLLAVIGVCHELRSPVISAEDGVCLLLFLDFAMSGIAGMLDELVQEARMNGVQHIEEPFSGMSLLSRSPLILHMEPH